MSSTVFNCQSVSVRGARLPRSVMRRRHSGYTLIEVLIGVTITLILLGIMIRAFSVAGDAISNGRAVIELSGELRSASETLRHDLRSATVRFLTWSATGADEGYFEMLEGVTRDYSFVGATDPANNNAIMDSYGDGDDMVMLTARNLEHPYQGMYNNTVIESKVAEIIWWTVLNDRNGDGLLNVNETITLHRRVLLVAPQVNNATSPLHPVGLADGICATAITMQAFLQSNDISVRVDANGNLVANTLADLSKRENRFGHNTSNFPFPIDRVLMNSMVLQGGRQGEDVVLSHIAAFDAKLFDPEAVIRGYALPNGEAVAVTPADPGYTSATSLLGKGTFVDLNYAGNPNLSLFSGPPHVKSGLGQNVYCTWSSSYERDGIDQDGVAPADQGTNGLDDDNAHGADDEAERETSPPYAYPLRGVQVTFRVRDPASQQIRQTSIESSFIPE